MGAAQIAALAASVLIGGVAAFQYALALGAPYGDAVFGGKAPTEDGVLTGPFRLIAVVQAVVLGILAFLMVNTAANFGAPHPIERWVMGSVTLILSVLTLVIAASS